MVGASRVSSTYRRLAAALRAGDDATAASLAEKAQIPSVLLTEWSLGPCGAVDADTAALALGGVAALADSAPPSPECLRDSGAIAVVADAIELTAVNSGNGDSHPWAAGIGAIDPAGFPGVPELFRARAAEGSGHSDEARALVELSLRESPGLVPAMRDAMEYELCAGNWERASELASALGAGNGLRNATGDRHGDQEVADRLHGSLERLQKPSPGAERAGRNQPCPCGSGRKYKVCCRAADLKGGVFTLADRAPALYAMLATFAQRAGSRTVTDRFRACAIGAPHADLLAVDLAVFEGGIGERFLAARGHLLRPDERDLLRDWLTQPVDLYEVTRVSAGSELTVRSMTGGPDRIRMRDRLLSLTAYRLDVIVTRLLPDGDRLPDGGPLLRVLGGIAKLDRSARRKPALEVFAEYSPARRAVGAGSPDASAVGFPARLLSQFVPDGTPVCLTSDGDEYQFCETSIEVSGGRNDVWDVLTRPCVPAPEPPIRSMAGYDAYIADCPPRFWTRNDDGEIEYVGVSDADRLVNRGTVERTRKGFKITANSVRRAEELVTIVLDAASEAGRTGKVTSQSAKTAQEMVGEHDADDKPDGRAAMCRRFGIDQALIAVPPREVMVEEFFLPLEQSAAGGTLVGQITRELTTRSMLEAREYDGCTPAEAVKAGGPALDKVLAMIDDCEWQLADAEPETALAMARPDELRRRIGLRGR